MLAKKRSTSLSTIIVITTILLTTVPIVVFGLLSSKMIEQSLNDQANQFNVPIADAVSDKMILSFRDHLTLLMDVRTRILTSGTPVQGFSAGIKNAPASGLFRRIELTDAQGRVAAQWPVSTGRIGADLNGNQYDIPFAKGYGYYLSSQYVSFENGNAVLDLVLPCGDGFLIGTIEAAQIQSFFNSLMNYQNVVIGILDGNGIWLASTDLERVSTEEGSRFTIEKREAPGDAGSWANMAGEKFHVYASPITNSDWQIVILSPLDRIERTTEFFKMGITFAIVILLVLSFGVLLLINRRVKGETRQILDFSERISSGKYAFLSPPRMFKEMEELLDNFEGMAKKIEKREREIQEKNKSILIMNIQLEERVRDRTQQLHLTNNSLEKALLELRDMQEQLIETERMANLGNLVAGVAHEINTPIGVSISSASFMEQQIRKIKYWFENNELKRSSMEATLDKLLEGSAIITTNLNNAAELIRSFKRIAVDRSLGETRRINVLEYIEGVVLSLKPELRRHSVKLDVDPPDIEFDCNPGEFSQVIGNLLTNAVKHAFESVERGSIEINGRAEHSNLILKVTDNGVGIPEEYLKSIYEPFFTTKRGSGGTGLGLNIVYNIVKQKFGGTMHCDSELGKGTCFTLTIPLHDKTETTE